VSDAPRTLQITVRDNPSESRFEALTPDGEVAGFSEYARHPDRIVILHTEVAERFEGQGVGGTLVRGELDEVAGLGLRVVASCPFVKAWIARHPDYAPLTR
jgi:predicted GNAT family acetyltransferase